MRRGAAAAIDRDGDGAVCGYARATDSAGRRVSGRYVGDRVAGG